MIHTRPPSRVLKFLRSWSRRAWLLHAVVLSSLILGPSQFGHAVTVRSYQVLDVNGEPIQTRQYEDWNGNQAYDTSERSWNQDVTDSDSDGLVNAREIAWGTDPYNPDTDYDGITDGNEVDLLGGPLAGYSPLLWDTDNDGFSDHDEFYNYYGVNYLTNGQGHSYYDWDGDGFKNPIDYNPLQSSLDNGVDHDGDGYVGEYDSHPNLPFRWSDWNNNGLNAENEAQDLDHDGWADSYDSHPENSDRWMDWNDDGSNDTGLIDTDLDGFPNQNDTAPNDPTMWSDWNGDGYNDTQEPDPDLDGVWNKSDSHPNNPYLYDDWNNDGRNDSQYDSDGDGVVDSVDTHDYDPTRWYDLNNDGFNDHQHDSDGDGYVDSVDTHDNDPTRWEDNNNDGYNDNADHDGDGVKNSQDSHITNPNLWSDRNNDGFNDDQDEDGDGVLNSLDTHISDETLWSDYDNDGLNKEDELVLGTNPNNPDTDADGLWDKEEVTYGTNPKIKDTDNDGLTDYEELVVYGELVINGKHFDPKNANSVSDIYIDYWMVSLQDSDGDGIPNLIELSYQGKLNPSDPLDAQGDLDADGFTNLEEYQNGARFDGNLQVYDFDRDGMTDIEEEYWKGVQPGLMDKFWFDDSVQDPDGDGVLNFEEVRYGLDPTNASTHAGVSDLDWVNQNRGKSWALPLLPGDVDGDGLPDLWEHRYFLDVRNPATPAENPDGDSYSNLQEYQASRHPLIRDFGSQSTPPVDTEDPLGQSANQPYVPTIVTPSGNASSSRSFNVVEGGFVDSDDSLTPRVQTYKKENVVEAPDYGVSTGWITHSDFSQIIQVKADGPDAKPVCEPTGDISTATGGATCSCQHGTANRFKASVIEPMDPYYTYGGFTMEYWSQQYIDGLIDQAFMDSLMSTYGQVPPWERIDGHSGHRMWEGNDPCPVENVPQKNSWAFMRLALPQNLPDNAPPLSLQAIVEYKSEDGTTNVVTETMSILPGDRYSWLLAGGSAPIKGHVKIVLPPQDNGASVSPVPLSYADAAGSRYRKVGLNGIPIPDSKPQVQSENGENPEETYVDPFLCQLRHSTSDVYVEAPGSLIPLAVRRSLTSDAWNDRSGLRAEERPYEPFGPGWTSNICSYVRFEDSNTAEVHDEDGSVSNYYRLNVNTNGGGGAWYHDRQEHRDVKTRHNSFAANRDFAWLGDGLVPNLPKFSGIQLTKKFGTKCYYEMVSPIALHQALRQDRMDYMQPVKSYTYARLTRVVDRTGNELVYEYSSPSSLIPSRIHDPKRAGHQIWIQQENGRVVKVLDPRGNDIVYTYQPLNIPSTSVDAVGDAPAPYQGYQRSSASVLTKVAKGGNASEVAYAYRMLVDRENGDSGLTCHTHIELTSIEDENHQKHLFDHQLNRSQYYWDGTNTRMAYGLPMRLNAVILPQGLGQVSLQTTRIINPSGGNFATAAPDFYTTVGWEGQGAQRTYTYKFKEAEFLVPSGNPQATGNPNAVTYAFKKMEIIAPAANGEVEAARTETYQFLPTNSMALWRVTDRNGRQTEFEYGTDGFDDPVKEINKTTTVTQGKFEKTLEYSNYRLLKKTVDEGGTIADSTFDTSGKRMSETATGSAGVIGGFYKTWKYENYNLPGMVTEEKIDAPAGMRAAPLNMTTTIFPAITTTFATEAYNSKPGWWRMVTSRQTINGQQAATKTIRDFSGNTRSVTDPRGMTTTFDYDAQNRLVQANYPDGTFKALIYDPHGNLIRERNEDGVFTFHTYDVLNRRTSSTIDLNQSGQPDGRYTAVSYNGIGQAIYNGDIVTEVLEYNSLNQPVREVDARGIQTLREYDVLGRLLAVTVNADSTNHVKTTYAYRGSVATNGVVEAGGSVFDVSGFKPVSTKDAMGNTTTFTYDDLYRCIKTTRPDGNVLHTTYDRKGRVSSQTSAALPAWVAGTTGYDTAPTDAEALKYYAKRLKQKTATEPVFVTQIFYDALGNVTKTVLPDLNGVWPNLKTGETLYTPHGKVWKKTDKAGVVSRFEYDQAGLQSKSHLDNPSAATATTQINYDLAGNAVKLTDPLGRITLTHYDKRNRPVKVVSPKVLHYGDSAAASEVTVTAYDAMGRTAEVINPLGYSSRNFYDAVGRVIYKEDAKGNLTRFSYDAGGNILTVRDARENITTNVYDHFSRLVKTTDAEGQHTMFAHDKNGNRIIIMDARAPGAGWTAENAYDWAELWRTNTAPSFQPLTAFNVTFRYDSLNRLVRQTFANADTVTSAYTLDRKTSDTNARAKATTYTYDMGGRVTNKAASHLATGTANMSSTLTYDLNKGFLTKAVDIAAALTATSPGATVEYQYDAIGRMTGEESYGRQHTYEYDLVGNRLRSLLASYGATPRIITTAYDALNRPKTITDDVQTASNVDDRITAYEYDRAGRAVKMVSANNQVTLNEYDENGRLIHRWLYQHMTNLTSSGQLAEFNWSYDEIGNVVTQAETWSAAGTNPAHTRTTVMTYDNVLRLKTETATDSRYATTTTAYQYDGASNRLSKEMVVGSTGTVPPGVQSGYWLYTYNASNQLTRTRKWANVASISGAAQAGSTYAYDADGNRISRVLDGTATLVSRTSEYVWDSWNRLDNVEVPQALNSTGRKLYQYEYDYRMRRRSVQQSGGGLPTLYTATVFSGGLSVGEFVRTTNAAIINTSIPSVEYLRGPDMGGGVGGLLATFRNPPNGNLYKLPTVADPKKVRFNLSNGRGDIVAQSDGGGLLTWTASYEAYGKRPAETVNPDGTSANADRQRANSKDEDPTGLLNEGFRYRDIETGVWLSRDPAGFVDGPNLYAYVRQNPWTSFDPDGLLTVETTKKTNRKGEEYKHTKIDMNVVVIDGSKNKRTKDELAKVGGIYKNAVEKVWTKQLMGPDGEVEASIETHVNITVATSAEDIKKLNDTHVLMIVDDIKDGPKSKAPAEGLVDQNGGLFTLLENQIVENSDKTSRGKGIFIWLAAHEAGHTFGLHHPASKDRFGRRLTMNGDVNDDDNPIKIPMPDNIMSYTLSTTYLKEQIEGIQNKYTEQKLNRNPILPLGQNGLMVPPHLHSNATYTVP